MALTAQKVSIWRARIEHYLDILSVFKDALTNNHYEGDLKENATLKIISISDVSVTDYTGGWTDGDFNTPSTSTIDFTLDQKKKILLKVPDTDQQGSAGFRILDEAAKRAAYAISNARDQFLASLYTDITSNVLGTDVAPIVVGFNSAAGEVLPSVALSQMIELLSTANADMSQPQAVLPVWFGSFLYQEFGMKNTGGGDSSMTYGSKPGKMEGLPNNAGGFANLYLSNNVANTASALYKVMAGTPAAGITYASVIDKLEGGRVQNDFADFLKGLFVYGGTVPYQQHMALGTFNKGTARTV